MFVDPQGVDAPSWWFADGSKDQQHEGERAGGQQQHEGRESVARLCCGCDECGEPAGATSAVGHSRHIDRLFAQWLISDKWGRDRSGCCFQIQNGDIGVGVDADFPGNDKSVAADFRGGELCVAGKGASGCKSKWAAGAD